MVPYSRGFSYMCGNRLSCMRGLVSNGPNPQARTATTLGKYTGRMIKKRLCLWLVFFAIVEPSLARPVPGRGADSQTLLVYSRTVTPYSLSDNIEVLSCQLRRVMTRLTSISSDEVTDEMIAKADYLVIFCPQPNPRLPDHVV